MPWQNAIPMNCMSLVFSTIGIVIEVARWDLERRMSGLSALLSLVDFYCQGLPISQCPCLLCNGITHTLGFCRWRV